MTNQSTQAAPTKVQTWMMGALYRLAYVFFGGIVGTTLILLAHSQWLSGNTFAAIVLLVPAVLFLLSARLHVRGLRKLFDRCASEYARAAGSADDADTDD
jgi:NhaP-type Na+/H+ or K+/H+ antiporter